MNYLIKEQNRSFTLAPEPPFSPSGPRGPIGPWNKIILSNVTKQSYKQH